MDRSKVTAPRRLWIANVAGSVLLPLLAYWWLAIPERRTWQIALSAVFGLAIVLAAAWLCAATFRALAGSDMGRGALRAIPAVLVCVLFGLLLLLALVWVESHFQVWTNWTASWLTYRLRRPVKPEMVRRVLDALGWVVRWLVIPVLIVPRLGGASIGGFRGLRLAKPRKRFFFEYLLALIVGVWLPSVLINWVPAIGSFAGQAGSFVVRFGVAWGLGLIGWFWLAWSATRSIENGYRG